MKRILYILSVLMLTGCSQDERLEYNPELELLFQPSMYMQISHDDVESFGPEMDFAVRAWALPRNASWSKSWASATEFLPTSVASCNSTTSNSKGEQGRLWGLKPTVLWPDVDTTLTIIGYSPADAGCICDTKKGVTHTMDVKTDQTDLLYTRLCCDREKNRDGGIVPLIFEHALCRIDLRAVHCVSADEKITVKKITIDSVRHKGTFSSLAKPQWELEKSYTGFTLFEGSERLPGSISKPIGGYILLPPQVLETTITVEYEYTNAQQSTIPQRLSTVALETKLMAGRKYTFTLAVGADDVKFLQEILKEEQ